MKKDSNNFSKVFVHDHNPHNLPKDYELVFDTITRHYLL